MRSLPSVAQFEVAPAPSRRTVKCTSTSVKSTMRQEVWVVFGTGYPGLSRVPGSGNNRGRDGVSMLHPASTWHTRHTWQGRHPSTCCHCHVTATTLPFSTPPSSRARREVPSSSLSFRRNTTRKEHAGTQGAPRISFLFYFIH
jgi:hypothetical protein